MRMQRIKDIIQGEQSFERLYSMGFTYNGMLHAGDIVLRNQGTTIIGRESLYKNTFDVETAFETLDKQTISNYEQLKIPYPEHVKEWVAGKYFSPSAYKW